MKIYVFVFLCFFFTKSFSQKPIKFTLHISDVAQPDAFSVKLYKHLFDVQLPDLIKNSEKDANGNYSIILENQENPAYVTIIENFSGKSLPIIDFYLSEPGDNIDINIKKDTTFGMQGYSTFAVTHPEMSFSNFKMDFSGRGSEKYTWKYEYEKKLVTGSGDRLAVDSSGYFIAKDYPYNYFDHAEEEGFKSLNNVKSKISARAWQILNVDLFSSLEIQRLRELSYGFPKKDSILLKRVISKYRLKTSKIESKFNIQAMRFSPIYAQYILEKILFGINLKQLNHNLQATIQDIILQINSRYIGEVKDKVLTLLSLRLPRVKAAELIVEELMKTIKTEYCINELNAYVEKNFIGREAFPFLLPDSTGELFTLKQFYGKVIFVDFWFRGCGNCIQYYKTTVSKAEEKFQNNSNVVFITINTDKNRRDWIQGLNEGIYTSPEAINLYASGFDHPIVKAYRAWSAPRPILIGKDGKIFSNDPMELRGGGIVGLEGVINKALKFNIDSK